MYAASTVYAALLTKRQLYTMVARKPATVVSSVRLSTRIGRVLLISDAILPRKS